METRNRKVSRGCKRVTDDLGLFLLIYLLKSSENVNLSTGEFLLFLHEP